MAEQPRKVNTFMPITNPDLIRGCQALDAGDHEAAGNALQRCFDAVLTAPEEILANYNLAFALLGILDADNTDGRDLDDDNYAYLQLIRQRFEFILIISHGLTRVPPEDREMCEALTEQSAAILENLKLYATLADRGDGKLVERDPGIGAAATGARCALQLPRNATPEALAWGKTALPQRRGPAYYSLGDFIQSGRLRLVDGPTEGAERYLHTIAGVRFAYDRRINWMLVADCYARSASPGAHIFAFEDEFEVGKPLSLLPDPVGEIHVSGSSIRLPRLATNIRQFYAKAEQKGYGATYVRAPEW